MQYSTITADRFADVIAHLRQTFFVDEPLNKSVQINGSGQAGDCHEELEKHCYATMAEGVSVMALTEDNQIAGVCLNGIGRPGDLERGLAKLADSPDERFVRIFRLLYEESLRLDLFARYQIAEIFELRILSVDGRHRGRGLARELLAQSYRRAEAAGVPHLKGEATGYFSHRVLQSDGFELVGEAKYAERRLADGTAMFPVQAPHESLKIMIKKLTLTNNE